MTFLQFIVNWYDVSSLDKIFFLTSKQREAIYAINVWHFLSSANQKLLLYGRLGLFCLKDAQIKTILPKECSKMVLNYLLQLYHTIYWFKSTMDKKYGRLSTVN